jgi:hypothetical protein
MHAGQSQNWSQQVTQLNATDPLGQAFQEREVWHCMLGINIGHEQNGHHASFMRPVLVIQRFGEHLFWQYLSARKPLSNRNITIYSATKPLPIQHLLLS